MAGCRVVVAVATFVAAVGFVATFPVVPRFAASFFETSFFVTSFFVEAEEFLFLATTAGAEDRFFVASGAGREGCFFALLLFVTEEASDFGRVALRAGTFSAIELLPSDLERAEVSVNLRDLAACADDVTLAGREVFRTLLMLGSLMRDFYNSQLALGLDQAEASGGHWKTRAW